MQSMVLEAQFEVHKTICDCSRTHARGTECAVYGVGPPSTYLLHNPFTRSSWLDNLAIC